MAMNHIHESKWGTYHPAPNEDVAWTINDTRGYIDEGPACDKCGEENLSFAYVCLDGGECYCEECIEDVEIVPCDCE